VQIEKRAQLRIYRLNPEAMLEVEDWARQMTILWNKQFDSLDAFLEVQKQK
jgi:hypothetical protein